MAKYLASVLVRFEAISATSAREKLLSALEDFNPDIEEGPHEIEPDEEEEED